MKDVNWQQVADERTHELELALSEIHRLERRVTDLRERAENADYWQERAKRAEVKATQLEFELAKADMAAST